MHAINPSSRYDLSSANPVGMLVLLVIANLSIAMSYYVRIPIAMDFRHIVIPALSAASLLLFSLSMILVVSLTMRTTTSRYVLALTIANGLLAVTQQCIFLSSWLT